MACLDFIGDCLLRMRVLLEGMLVIGEFGHLEADHGLSERSRKWVMPHAAQAALYDLRSLMDEMQEVVLNGLEGAMSDGKDEPDER